MPRFELVPATEEHALDLASNLSLQSQLDCIALGRDPDALAVNGVRTSVCVFAGLIDGRCFCLFGVYPDTLTATSGQPWLLTSTDLKDGKVAFGRASRQYLPYLRNRFTHLYGFVYVENAVSIKWLKWLGYTVGSEPTTIGSFERRYYSFEWRAA